MGGLTVLPHRSKIIGEQLGAHIEQLIAAKFLDSYTLTKAKSRDGFVLKFFPGSAFFEDYDRFYGRGRKVTLPIGAASANHDNAEALKVAYLFAQKRTGQTNASIAFVSSKDKETAKQFLAQLAFEEMPDFFDFALGEARRTSFDVQTLGGIKPYLASYLAARKRYAAHAARETAQRKRMQAYDERQATEVKRLAAARNLFDALSAEDRRAIRQAAEDKAQKFPPGSLRDAMIKHHVARIMGERNGESLSSLGDGAADQPAT